jgi:ribosomal protein S18 acetylase RimI-like enzyme
VPKVAPSSRIAPDGWETATTGFRVGRSVGTLHGADDLASLVARARDLDVVYIESEIPFDPNVERPPEITSVGELVTYSIEVQAGLLAKRGAPGIGVLVALEANRIDARELAGRINFGGRHSRDPRFPATVVERVGKRWVEDAITQPGRLVLLGEANAGLCVIRGGDCITIELIGVVPDQRGRGVGQALVGASMKIASLLGIDTIRVGTYRGNTPAQQLYEGLGGDPVSSLHRYHLWMQVSGE